jgi:hypothetical protein
MLHLSGGADEPRALTVEFVSAFRGVHVTIENRWSTDTDDHYSAQARMGQAAFDALIDQLEADTSRAYEAPDMSEQQLGVGYTLPLDSGAVIGGAHDFVTGASPAVLADTVLDFVHGIEAESSFRAVQDDEFSWRSDQPANGGGVSWWFLAGNVASVAALASVISFLLLT